MRRSERLLQRKVEVYLAPKIGSVENAATLTGQGKTYQIVTTIQENEFTSILCCLTELGDKSAICATHQSIPTRREQVQLHFN